jgi:putative transposase
MKTSKFTDEQIAMALRQAEAGTPVGEICRTSSTAPIPMTVRPFGNIYTRGHG